MIAAGVWTPARPIFARRFVGFEVQYLAAEPTRDEVDRMAGAVVVEFGTDWCGHCRGAQPLIADAFAAYPTVQHLKIADGSGRRLGRSFGVKLWPTLIFMRDGREIGKLVRPRDRDSIAQLIEQIERRDPV